MSQPPAAPEKAYEMRRVLTMVKNERMGGMVPKWDTVRVEIDTPHVAMEQGFAKALDEVNEKPLAPAADEDDGFGFSDLIDMINPLQHIPVVSHIYRAISGDEIKTASAVIGGAVFGGPLGAAGGIANAISLSETGKSVAGNALGLMLGSDEQPDVQLASAPPQEAPAAVKDKPQVLDLNNLAGTTLALANLSTPEQQPAQRESREALPKSDHQNVIDNYPFMPRVKLTELFVTNPAHMGRLYETHQSPLIPQRKDDERG